MAGYSKPKSLIKTIKTPILGRFDIEQKKPLLREERLGSTVNIEVIRV
jgi:hypothetical protein